MHSCLGNLHISPLFGGSRCPSRRYQSHKYKKLEPQLVFRSGSRTLIRNWAYNQHISTCFWNSRHPSQGYQTDKYTPVFGTFSIPHLKRNPCHSPNTLFWKTFHRQPLLRRPRCHKYKKLEPQLVFRSGSRTLIRNWAYNQHISTCFWNSRHPSQGYQTDKCTPVFFEQDHTQQVLRVELI